jgi:Phage minor capsid protein 2.
MLKPSEIEDLTRVIDDCYAEIESNLIERICRSLAYGKQESNINQWRLRKLGQMGKLTRELRDYVSNEAYKGDARIEKAMDKAITDAYKNDMKMFDKAHVKTGANTPTPEIFERYKKSILANTRQAMNMTNTTAIQISQKAYKDAINTAWITARVGTTTIAKAVNKACHELGGTGLRVSYKSDSGRITTYPLDASIRRDLVTSLTQSTAQMVMAESEALGNDLVIISELADCRDTHLEFQNQVYSLSGKSRKYPSLASTGYGDPAGLFGCNCRHQMFPWFEDLDKKPTGMTADERAEAKENYKLSQQQRALERNIRETHRQWLADKAGDTGFASESKEAYQKAQREMASFIDSSGRTRRRDREMV